MGRRSPRCRWAVGTGGSHCWRLHRLAAHHVNPARTPRWPPVAPIANCHWSGAAHAGSRPALAAIPVNVAAAANPFSLTAQRQKATAARLPSHQKQQPSVRFAVDEPAAASRQPSGDVEIACCLGRSASAAATPAAAVPTTSNRAAGVAGTGGGASCGSPSPYVVFRGRLSFAAEADSGATRLGTAGRWCVLQPPANASCLCCS